MRLNQIGMICVDLPHSQEIEMLHCKPFFGMCMLLLDNFEIMLEASLLICCVIFVNLLTSLHEYMVLFFECASVELSILSCLPRILVLQVLNIFLKLSIINLPALSITELTD